MLLPSSLNPDWAIADARQRGKFTIAATPLAARWQSKSSLCVVVGDMAVWCVHYAALFLLCLPGWQQLVWWGRLIDRTRGPWAQMLFALKSNNTSPKNRLKIVAIVFWTLCPGRLYIADFGTKNMEKLPFQRKALNFLYSNHSHLKGELVTHWHNGALRWSRLRFNKRFEYMNTITW